MTPTQNSYWSSDRIVDLTDKRIVITGANSGLGLQAAQVLAAKGATVLMAVRNLSKGQEAIAALRQQLPQAQLQLLSLDLADLESVKRFSTQLLQSGEPIDVLINNAGVMMPERHTRSAQGHELHWATNHLGHFALTRQLLPLLEQAPAGRVITLSSLMAHLPTAKIHYDDLNFEQRYDKIAAYAQSKLANAMFAAELQRRLQESGSRLISLAAHPGLTATNLQQHIGKLGVVFNWLFSQPVASGVLPELMAATEPDLQGGEYIGPMQMAHCRGYPGRNRLPKAATDAAQCRRLWQVTEQLIGQRFLTTSSATLSIQTATKTASQTERKTHYA